MLQNLECEIHNLTIRVLTCEFHQDDLTKGVDIPTVLLRFTRIEYRNSVAPAKAEDNASSNLKSEVPPPAPALEEKRLAKTVLIGQYALFLMDRPILSRVPVSKRKCRTSLAGTPTSRSSVSPSATRQSVTQARCWCRRPTGPWRQEYSSNWTSRRSNTR